MNDYCPLKCEYLLNKIGYCAHPAFNGKAHRLKKIEGNFIRICKNVPKKRNELCESNCNPKCVYLENNYGVCMKYIRQLKRDGNNFFRICKNGELISTKNKANKYGSQKITVDGLTFDSKLEYERYNYLVLMQKAGEIRNLRHHVRFPLINKSEKGREIAYEADFVYEKDGKTVIEDTKSRPTKTRAYMLKKRLMFEKYGIQISEVMKGDV